MVNELRRDTNGLRNNDHFGALFDTFYERRRGCVFDTNPLGARADYWSAPGASRLRYASPVVRKPWLRW